MIMSANPAPKKKTSPIRVYFTISEDQRFATCLCENCGQQVSRGGKDLKSYGTTNLIVHLKSKHSKSFAEYEEKVKEAKEAKEQLAKSQEPRCQQLSLIECDNRTRCWDINDARSKRIHCRIGQMIAIDCHPLSLVEDEGFICLLKELEPRYSLPSRRYFTDNVLTKLFESLRDTVVQMITGVKYLSFTTGIWSTCVSNESLISLTAHWITNTFECRAAMLNAAQITASHTGSCIAEKISEILQSWGISSDRIHVILRDNGSNMIRAMKDGDLPNLGCFAHTLQLVVHDGVLAQQAVINLLAICRQIVGHFKHYPLLIAAYMRSKRI